MQSYKKEQERQFGVEDEDDDLSDSQEDDDESTDSLGHYRGKKNISNELRSPQFRAKDFKNKILKYLLNPREISFEADLDDLAYSVDPNTYKYWLFLGAFLLIHLERPIIKRLYAHDSWVQRQIDKVIDSYVDYDGDQSKLLKRQESMAANKSNAGESDNKNSLHSLKSLKTLKRSQTKLLNPVSLLSFTDRKYNIKNILLSEMGQKFASMALKIALIKRQEKIA